MTYCIYNTDMENKIKQWDKRGNIDSNQTGII